ncbi:MAG: tetratricopeptide repeat protein [Chitinophagaceae bacterium]
MKKLFFSLALLLSLHSLFAQGRYTDSLKQLILSEKSDLVKVELMKQLCFYYEDSKPDSALIIAQHAYFLAINAGYKKGESGALRQMSSAYKNLGNFSKSLESALTQLTLEESFGTPATLTVAYLSMASLYDDSKDFDKALIYAKKAEVLIAENKLGVYAPYGMLNLGDIYEKKNLLDSAILYTRQCLNISTQAGNALLTGTALNNLGNIYTKMGNYPEALKNYYASVPYETGSNNYLTYVETTLGIAKVYEQTAQMDSAFYYGKKAFAVASENQFTVRAMNTSSFLSRLYKKSKNIDSAFAYQEIMSVLKDSVESTEKIRELMNISSAEQTRQAEIEQKKLEEIQDRKAKLQLLFIGIMIPLFFFASIFISRKKVPKKVIELMGIISVLLFFEYITLMLHPFIAEKTHHNPIIEIIILMAIAAIISPTHHQIEHWLLKKLGAYNYLKHNNTGNDPVKNVTEAETATPVT